MSGITTRLEIRGDPEAALLWVSKSQRHLAEALSGRGFQVSHKLVGRLLDKLGFSLQANRKTRECSNHPDRDAQFEHINAQSKAFALSATPSPVSNFAISPLAAGACPDTS